MSENPKYWLYGRDPSPEGLARACWICSEPPSPYRKVIAEGPNIEELESLCRLMGYEYFKSYSFGDGTTIQTWYLPTEALNG